MAGIVLTEAGAAFGDDMVERLQQAVREADDAGPSSPRGRSS